MPHIPDATTKYAFDLHPRPWLALAGLPVPPTDEGVTMVDTTMPTVSMTADKLVRVDDGRDPYLAHVEFQTRRDVTFDRRMLRYNVWAGDTYGLPVRSVAFLFHRRAARFATGRVYERYDEQSLLDFRYRVIRLWALPVEPLLTGPIGTVTLAALSAADRELPAVIDRVRERFNVDLAWTEVQEMTDILSVFLGLRRKTVAGKAFVESIMPTLQEVMRESWTYQAMVREAKAEGRAQGQAEGRVKGRAEGQAEGRAAGMQEAILRLGEARLGPPSPAVVRRVRGATDTSELARWTDRLLTVDGWDMLLGE